VKITTGLLCDFASVREGLLFVVGGGITRVRRPHYPAALGCSVALLVELHQMELTRPHELEVRVVGPDGEDVGTIKAGFQTAPMTDLDIGENLPIPVVLDLRAATLPKPGRYNVEASIDGGHQLTLSFRATSATATEGPAHDYPMPTGD
jgi:hypothetical protein